jgi:hypothetical protein
MARQENRFTTIHTGNTITSTTDNFRWTYNLEA